MANFDTSFNFGANAAPKAPRVAKARTKKGKGGKRKGNPASYYAAKSSGSLK